MRTFATPLKKIVKAGQQLRVAVTGNNVDILDASLAAFKLGLGDSAPIDVQAGLSIPSNNGEIFTHIIIDNTGNTTTDLAVFLYVGNISLGDRRAVKNAPTYFVRQVGIPGANLDSNGYIKLNSTTYPNGLTVSGINNGNRRKQLFLSIANNSNNAVVIFDTNGNGALRCSTAPVTIETDATFILKPDQFSAGGNSLVYVGELYYSS